MPEVTEEELKEVLKEVAVTTPSYRVIFPWGFKIVEFKGEKVLQPLTPQEYRTAVAEDPGIKLTDEEMEDPPLCILDSLYCEHVECPGKCITINVGPLVYCVCVY